MGKFSNWWNSKYCEYNLCLTGPNEVAIHSLWMLASSTFIFFNDRFLEAGIEIWLMCLLSCVSVSFQVEELFCLLIQNFQVLLCL